MGRDEEGHQDHPHHEPRRHQTQSDQPGSYLLCPSSLTVHRAAPWGGGVQPLAVENGSDATRRFPYYGVHARVGQMRRAGDLNNWNVAEVSPLTLDAHLAPGTGSLWNHVTGNAIAGPLKGQAVQSHPASHTTWERWRRLHPETFALSKQTVFGVEGTHSAYRGYFDDPAKLGIFGTRNPDTVLPGKEFVLGLSLGTTIVAYPYRDLNRRS